VDKNDKVIGDLWDIESEAEKDGEVLLTKYGVTVIRCGSSAWQTAGQANKQYGQANKYGGRCRHLFTFAPATIRCVRPPLRSHEMSDGVEHVEQLRTMRARMKNESSDLVIGDMIVEFGALVVTLSTALDKTQRRVMWLTWAVVILTAVLVTMPFVERAIGK
jgi:hypothetical protein